MAGSYSCQAEEQQSDLVLLISDKLMLPLLAIFCAFFYSV